MPTIKYKPTTPARRNMTVPSFDEITKFSPEKSLNVFPSQIEEVILGFEELGPHYEIILERDGYLDKLTVKVELAHSTDSFAVLEKITGGVRGKLRTVLGLDAKVLLVSPNTLQRFEGKAKRVKDLRNKQ